MTRVIVVRAILCATLAGCGYTSQYRPPLDARARAVWDRNTVRAHLGVQPSKDCDQAVVETMDQKAPLVIAQDYHYVPRAGPVVVVGYAPFLWYAPFVPFHPIGAVAPAIASGSGGDLFKGAIFAMAIAVVVLPIVDIAIAAWDPEDDGVSSLSIDTVNAYNDLNRTGGSPCAAE